MQVEKAIKELETEGRKAAAVFVTSPTYHGICSDINKIAMLCHSRNIPLIVDEAHGAHFEFHSELPSSSLSQGADLVMQSTHKVLCSLQQSSMLHMSGNIVDREKIRRCLQSLQSTSPSSLLLSSLDAARAQISDNQQTIFDKALKLAFEAKRLIQEIPGISLLDLQVFSSFSAIDPLRITVGVWELGVSGFEADDILDKEYGVVSELTGMQCVTYVITLGTSRQHIQRLVLGLKHLSDLFYTDQGSGKEGRLDGSQKYLTCSLEDTRIKLSPREAFFARKRTVSLAKSIGEICGELICPYPPGIPLLIPGEIIKKTTLDYLLQVKSNGGVITGAADPLLDTIVVCDG
ncbi:Ser/Thr protein phosphatase family protein, expressed [Heracleum sosnowskyi]|uniref:Ser/Thr protein phosphatase family protein, expressed n=1 Tax=Heracleum sosnowskyi TaxID=360622 RepID=A0AAD8NA44_9APIA|nr:Ser/Thr protein phosphatase family protein, expressed [Heracleum sosnowskyi]